MTTHMLNCGCCAQHADLVIRYKRGVRDIIKSTSSTDRPLKLQQQASSGGDNNNKSQCTVTGETTALDCGCPVNSVLTCINNGILLFCHISTLEV